MTKKEVKLLGVALGSAIEKVGGTAKFEDGKLVLGGACSACPLEICNDTIGLTYASEIEVSTYCCPVSGSECPLFIYFTEVAKFLWRETGGYRDTKEGTVVSSLQDNSRIRWLLVVDSDEARENFPIFRRERGKFRIVRWEESVSERDVYKVKEQVFPFALELRR
jgi:hypothetical protein